VTTSNGSIVSSLSSESGLFGKSIEFQRYQVLGLGVFRAAEMTLRRIRTSDLARHQGSGLPANERKPFDAHDGEPYAELGSHVPDLNTWSLTRGSFDFRPSWRGQMDLGND
jgi:hypothetical protein